MHRVLLAGLRIHLLETSAELGFSQLPCIFGFCLNSNNVVLILVICQSLNKWRIMALLTRARYTLQYLHYGIVLPQTALLIEDQK